MQRVLRLAREHRTHPNPRVGSLVVSESGVVVGEGVHVGPGEDHAEVAALKAAGSDAEGATLYVSLEPCAHSGRTPPCVDAIIAAGVRRVVVGVVDPDRRVSGEGVRRLREAGVEVIEDFLPEQARSVDPAYFHHRETGLPLVTLKYAMTLDGSVAARDRSSQWITSEPAREDAHRLRAEADAVVVGAGTLRSDDPRLDVRLPGYRGPQPRPVILSGAADLPREGEIWARDPLVVTTTERYLPAGDQLIVSGAGGRPDPRETCLALADTGYLDILFEGGPTIAAAWWRAGVVTRGVAYIGAKLAGGGGIPPLAGVFETMGEAMPAKIVASRSLGPDLRIDFEQA